MNKNLYAATHQKGKIINTLNPKADVGAWIYDEQQLDMINSLIEQGYLPHHTSVGVGKLNNAKWRIESYHGRWGEGVKMITYSPLSTNFNHLTYFLQQC